MGQKQSAPVSTATATGLAPHQNPQTATPDGDFAAAESRLNPFSQDAASHNFGQPASSERGASKQQTDCRAQQRASLACIEENYQDKNVACAEFFHAYKTCRKAEHERKLEANARASGWYD